MKKFFQRVCIGVSACFFLCACAQLHHVQIGDISSYPQFVSKPFDIKISEVGINLDDATAISKTFLSKDSQQQAENIRALIGLFQMGPVTGNPVYTKGYASGLIQVLYEKCPSGRITGLTSVRESRKYPVISGEIVHITGFCLLKKGENNAI